MWQKVNNSNKNVSKLKRKTRAIYKKFPLEGQIMKTSKFEYLRKEDL